MIMSYRLCTMWKVYGLCGCSLYVGSMSYGLGLCNSIITMKQLWTTWWLWNTRALCDRYEIFVHYMIDLKYMCTIWLNMRYMAAISDKWISECVPPLCSGQAMHFTKWHLRPYHASGSGLGDHTVTPWAWLCQRIRTWWS